MKRHFDHYFSGSVSRRQARSLLAKGAAAGVVLVPDGMEAWHDGVFTGTSALVVCRLDGIVWAVTFNTENDDSPSMQQTVRRKQNSSGPHRWPFAIWVTEGWRRRFSSFHAHQNRIASASLAVRIGSYFF